MQLGGPVGSIALQQERSLLLLQSSAEDEAAELAPLLQVIRETAAIPQVHVQSRQTKPDYF